MEAISFKRVSTLALLGLFAVGAMTACTPLVQSEENYKQSALSECDKEPTGPDYNNCVNRAKMEAAEFDIEQDKKLKPQ